MATKKITELTNYTPPINTDVFPIVDVTTATTKKITWANIKSAIGAIFGYKTFLTVGSANADYITDGTADDVQIQAAIDAVNAAGGGTVFIKAGTYNFTTLVNAKSNVSIVGEGVSTVLKADSLIARIIKIYSVNNVSVEKIKMDDSVNENVGFMGIDIRDSNDIIVDRCIGIQSGASVSGTYVHVSATLGNYSRRVWITRNYFTGLGYGDLIAGGAFSMVSGGVEDLWIMNNYVKQDWSQGNGYKGAIFNVKVKNCHMINNNVYGYIGFAQEITPQTFSEVRGNIIEQGGVQVYGQIAGTITSSAHLLIAQNTINVGQIQLYGSETYPVQNVSITNNIIKGGVYINYPNCIEIENAIYCDVSNNIMEDDVTGIKLTGVTYSNFSNNVFSDFTNGFKIISESDNSYQGNVFGTNVTNKFSASVTTGIVRNNKGYVTENSGTATIASGQTTIVVTHGLSATPTADDISVTPTNGMGNATKFWITTLTATQFTINCDVDPSTDTATFAWKAIIL